MQTGRQQYMATEATIDQCSKRRHASILTLEMLLTCSESPLARSWRQNSCRWPVRLSAGFRANSGLQGSGKPRASMRCHTGRASSRSCPWYFIRRFTQPGQVVYDPFSGRGTTAIEAALSGRTVIANDINPLATILARPRINVPTVSEVEERLRSISYSHELVADLDLSMFFESKTELEILSLRTYLSHRRHDRTEDHVDEWIRMTATNRLTGHSPGFFSVYTFPPNQAVSAASQVRINERRKQKPTYRDTKALIAIKTRQLLRGLSNDQLVKLRTAAAAATFLTRDARATPDIPDSSVQLTVTSPPFLDVRAVCRRQLAALLVQRLAHR